MMNDHDPYEYVPLESHPEGPKTFMVKITIEPEGTPRVEIVGQETRPSMGTTRP